ncbi:MAG: hypothetical protein MJ154_02515 [Candidatus Saccharibacteria bacterium]|nr:hypothetical protein [Candidatus Saccharibacteria bacterium]
MNEDGNPNLPQSPIFSDPNTETEVGAPITSGNINQPIAPNTSNQERARSFFGAASRRPQQTSTVNQIDSAAKRELQSYMSSDADSLYIVNDVKPKKSKKPLFIALGAIAVVAIVVVAIIMGTSSKSVNKNDIITAFNEFEADYENVLSVYDYDEGDISKILESKIKETSLFIMQDNVVNETTKALEKVKSSYANMEKNSPEKLLPEGERAQFNDAKNKAKEHIDIIESNVALFSSLNKAYINTVSDLVKGKIETTSGCSLKTDAMEALEKDKKTAEIAKKYYKAVCDINDDVLLGVNRSDKSDYSVSDAKREVVKNLGSLYDVNTTREYLRGMREDLENEK